MSNPVRIAHLLFALTAWSATLHAIPAPAAAESEHDDHEEEIVMTPTQVEAGGIRTAAVSRGALRIELALNGEVHVNQDRLAHIAPRVSGIVREVRRTLGATVAAGDILAIIDSRELAGAKAAYLAAQARLDLAQATYDREAGLWEQKLSAEQDYLEARQDLAEARIALRSLERQLHALGLDEADIAQLPEEHGDAFTGYALKAPFAGTIVERHITVGEQVQAESRLYTLSDLDTVWVIANVYEKDVALVRVGQPAAFTVGAYPDRVFHGDVTWVADTMDEDTRTVGLRLEVDNAARLLKPGMFADVAVAVGSRDAVLLVPRAALQEHEGRTVVFVEEDAGRYAPRPVELGARSATDVEILRGLDAGERIVTAGSYIVKSEAAKREMGGGHSH